MAAELFALVVAIGVAGVLVWTKPRTTKRWYQRLTAMKNAIVGVLSVVVALFLISTGVPTLILIGFASLVFGVLWIVFDEPHKEYI